MIAVFWDVMPCMIIHVYHSNVSTKGILPSSGYKVENFLSMYHSTELHNPEVCNVDRHIVALQWGSFQESNSCSCGQEFPSRQKLGRYSTIADINPRFLCAGMLQCVVGYIFCDF